MGREQAPKGVMNAYRNLQKQPAWNYSTTNTIPAFGLVRVVNSQNGVLWVDRPNADGQDVYVNGPTAIPPQTYCQVSRAWPLFAAYDAASGTPGVNDGLNWGAKAGSYLLTANRTGFVIQAAPNATGKRVLIAPPTTTKPIWIQVDLNAPSFVQTPTTGAATILVYPGAIASYSGGAFTPGSQGCWWLPTGDSIPLGFSNNIGGSLAGIMVQAEQVDTDLNGVPVFRATGGTGTFVSMPAHYTTTNNYPYPGFCLPFQFTSGLAVGGNYNAFVIDVSISPNNSSRVTYGPLAEFFTPAGGITVTPIWTDGLASNPLFAGNGSVNHPPFPTAILALSAGAVFGFLSTIPGECYYGQTAYITAWDPSTGKSTQMQITGGIITGYTQTSVGLTIDGGSDW